MILEPYDTVIALRGLSSANTRHPTVGGTGEGGEKEEWG